MKKHSIPTLRRVPAALLRARELQARFCPAVPICVPVVPIPVSTIEVEPGGEIYGPDGEPVLWPERDEIAPPVDDEPLDLGRVPAALSTVEILSPSIEADIAAIEARERYAFDLGRARANYACLLAEKSRLLGVARSVRAAGRPVLHLQASIDNIARRVSELEVAWCFEDLAIVGGAA